ncbi:MAG: HD domain-containing protein [Desulfurococcaceae archaeon]
MSNVEREGPLPWVLPFNAQVRDVIYSYIDYIKGVEDLVIDSWPLQRLRYVQQLQAAHFVYPSATHSRFSHSLGVMHVSGRYASQMIKSALEALPASSRFLQEIRGHVRELVLAARLLGLLHDIGHGPFSHAFDTYVYKTRKFLNYVVGNHEIVGYLIYRDYLREVIGKGLSEGAKYLGIDPEYVLEVLDEGMKPPPGMREYTELTSRNVLGPDDFFYPTPDKGVKTLIRLIVRDYVYTSDIIDYLRRDSYYTGLAIGGINEEWIIRNTFTVEYQGLLTLALSTKAIDDLRRLLEARKLMYKNVYFHHVNIAFVETLGRLFDCLKSFIAGVLEDMFSDPAKLSKYVALTDASVYGLLSSAGVSGKLECEDEEFARKALESVLMRRKPLWKMVHRISADLRDVRTLFSARFGEQLQAKFKEEVVKEVSSALAGKGIDEKDVLVLINKVDVYPSSSSEIVRFLLLTNLKDNKPLGFREEELQSFAIRNGLISEVLLTLYIDRSKYSSLSEQEVARARDAFESVARDLAREAGREAPETS